jgi:hypothetical protein
MTSMKRTLGTLAAVALLGLGSQQALAISTIGNCEVGDVTSSTEGAADACYGLVRGNISEGAGAQNYENRIPDSAFGGAFAGNNWTVLDIDFSTGSHTWSGILSGYQELIIVLKQSTLWGAWYFNVSSNAGTWSTTWVYPNGGGGQAGGLSHGFALGRGTREEVPEPGTLALFGLGMLGLGFARRRRA